MHSGLSWSGHRGWVLFLHHREPWLTPVIWEGNSSLDPARSRLCSTIGLEGLWHLFTGSVLQLVAADHKDSCQVANTVSEIHQRDEHSQHRCIRIAERRRVFRTTLLECTQFSGEGDRGFLRSSTMGKFDCPKLQQNFHTSC